MRPIEMVLAKKPPDPTVALDIERDMNQRWDDRDDYVVHVAAEMNGTRTKMKATKEIYRRDYDRRIKRRNEEIKDGYYI